jgi:hypothetical protein
MSWRFWSKFELLTDSFSKNPSAEVSLGWKFQLKTL